MRLSKDGPKKKIVIGGLYLEVTLPASVIKTSTTLTSKWLNRALSKDSSLGNWDSRLLTLVLFKVYHLKNDY